LDKIIKQYPEAEDIELEHGERYTEDAGGRVALVSHDMGVPEYLPLPSIIESYGFEIIDAEFGKCVDPPAEIELGTRILRELLS